MFEWIESITLGETTKKWLSTLITFLVLFLIRTLLNSIVNRRIKDLRNRYLWRQTTSYIILVVGLALVVTIWFEWFRSILTMLTLVAAAITIVSKELLLNLMAYGVIVWRGLFNIGDRIQVGQFSGDVIEAGPFYFGLAEIGNWAGADDTTGRVVKVPNSLVLTFPVSNYTRGRSLIWNEIRVELELGSDWESAESIAKEVLEQVSHTLNDKDYSEIRKSSEEMIFIRQEPGIYLYVEDGMLILQLRYLCKFYKRRQTTDIIWRTLLSRFKDHPKIKPVLKKK